MNAPYRRPMRLYTAPIHAVFPLDLLKAYPLPKGAVFKSLQIENLFVHYHHDQAVEYLLPNDMKTFNRVVLRQPLGPLEPNAKADGPPLHENPHFVGALRFDKAASAMPGMVHTAEFRLVYDPATGLLSGAVTPRRTIYPDGVADIDACPVRDFSLGLCLQFYPD
jgi:hypothetical protein